MSGCLGGLFILFAMMAGRPLRALTLLPPKSLLLGSPNLAVGDWVGRQQTPRLYKFATYSPATVMPSMRIVGASMP
jgi:hypothetical protein